MVRFRKTEKARSAHGTHDDTVFDFHITDFPGRKKRLIFLIHAMFTPFFGFSYIITNIFSAVNRFGKIACTILKIDVKTQNVPYVYRKISFLKQKSAAANMATDLYFSVLLIACRLSKSPAFNEKFHRIHRFVSSVPQA